ncbi:hypothetical protein VTN31DRAFT_1229 [Thermomyces dupontii]|uniref:uncharacterized protein n=1 Tax=Talaromyces thermophilus TaxID=28565 RepID=UPI0037447920
MSSFVALNIEPDETIEEEVDDTKELQIEEALKLYQNALKFHAQGPEFYPQAREAYEALFNSDIFKYPDAISFYDRIALHDAPDDVVDLAADTFAELDVNDAATSALPQTLFLSYKNRGQFVMDSLQDSMKKELLSNEHVEEQSRLAMQMFAEALDKDDTDLDIWRKGARLGEALQSYRLTRYCLEGVVVDDDNEVEVRPQHLGLEESFATEDLHRVLRRLHDELSILQAPPVKPQRKALFKLLDPGSRDPFPHLPAIEDLESQAQHKSGGIIAQRHMLSPAAETWAAVGNAIVEVAADPQQISSRLRPGDTLGISLPSTRVESTIETDSPEMDSPEKLEGGAPSQSENREEEMVDVQCKDPDVAPPADSTGPSSTVDTNAPAQLRESLETSKPDQDNELKRLDADDAEAGSPSAIPRKRSSTAAAPEDTVDNGRAKSRRIRARESHAEGSLQAEDAGFDQAKYFEDRLEIFSYADEWLFGAVGDLLSRAGVDDLGAIDELKKQVFPVYGSRNTADKASQSEGTDGALFHELHAALSNWDEDKSKVMLRKNPRTSSRDFGAINKSGLAIFLEHSKKYSPTAGIKATLNRTEELQRFVQQINEDWLHLHEVAYRWLAELLQPGPDYLFEVDSGNEPAHEATYTAFLWPEDLKATVTELLIRADGYVYERISGTVQEFENQVLQLATSGDTIECTSKSYGQLEMIQSIYELHLDVYSSLNSPDSEVDLATRVAQHDRLCRWRSLAHTAVNHLMDKSVNETLRTRMALRHMWATTFHSKLAEDAPREHVLHCLLDLRNLLLSMDDPKILLVNNSFMPEISVSVLDQEISRLRSMEFFTKIFGSDGEDPVTLIESLQPILEPSSVQFVKEDAGASNGSTALTEAQFRELASFLDRGDATLRLYLWRRLQEAWIAIDHPPKAVSCQIRSIEIIVREIRGPSFMDSEPKQRPMTLLKWLRSIDELMIEVLPQLIEHPQSSFECIDLEHLQSSMSAVAKLARLLHSFALFEDAVRVGQVQPSDHRGPLGKSLESVKEKLRDMQVRCWVLLYLLLREYMTQEKDAFDIPTEDRINYLRALHNSLGVRGQCKYADKLFLKLMRDELLHAETDEDCRADISQVLFDLHGLKFSSQYSTDDHGCPVESLDKKSATTIVDFVLLQADRMNIKDVAKSELKTTMEKVQQAIGMERKVQPLTFNRRLINSYLKSPLNPSHLFRAVQGIGGLPFKRVHSDSVSLAQKGWFYLLGYASLMKFRSQKRLNPVSTADLDEAILYFRYDLEHATDRWESWYRLAQALDSKLEEDITWSADKLNNNSSDLIVQQRMAINAYAMAVAVALNNAENDPKSRATLSDLFTDFGIRLYASSRDPLSMGAFSLADFERHFSDLENRQMYTGRPFKEMDAYSVWTLASHLFRRAMVDKPNYWMNHYMLSKCLWKMFNSDESARGRGKPVHVDQILDSLLDAIETLPVPSRKDRGPDPIFEPHFRLVSVLHKLVTSGKMEPRQAGEILSETQWGRKFSVPEDIDGWKPYVLDVLKNLKNADKSNWHHRILARAARVHYESQKDAAGAAAAKNELMPQIFTKTLTLQVWRPEHERPGRHFVYTTRYMYFFLELIEKANDRQSLDQLLRRLRKKQGDFINHTKLWEDMCLVYARLLRDSGDIPEKLDDTVFKGVSWDEFVANTARLEGLSDLAKTHTSTLELLRDAVELKKLNNGLIKPTLFEDLVADVYARLYQQNLPRLVEQTAEENRERMKVDHLLMSNEGGAEASTPGTPAPPSEAPPVPRGRTKGIARRDIQKRAEAIVAKHLGTRPLTVRPATTAAANNAATTSATVNNTGTATTMTTTTTPTGPADSYVSAGASATNASRPTGEDSQKETQEEAPSRAQVSFPASTIQDSADEDESELSEIDDDKLASLKPDQSTTTLLFPNLKVKELAQDGASEFSAQPSVEEDGDGDGDEVESGNENDPEAGTETVIADDEREGEGEEDEEEEAEDEEMPDVADTNEDRSTNVEGSVATKVEEESREERNE